MSTVNGEEILFAYLNDLAARKLLPPVKGAEQDLSLYLNSSLELAALFIHLQTRLGVTFALDDLLEPAHSRSPATLLAMVRSYLPGV